MIYKTLASDVSSTAKQFAIIHVDTPAVYSGLDHMLIISGCVRISWSMRWGALHIHIIKDYLIAN